MVYIVFRKNKTKISCIKKTKQKKERVREERDIILLKKKCVV